MKILVIAPSLWNTSPGSRFRIEQWMPYMEREGVSFTYAAFEDEALHEVIHAQGKHFQKAWGLVRSFGRRLGLVRELARYDAIFLYEEASRIGPAFIERLIAMTGVPIVYDFCDPIYLPYKSPVNSYLSHLKFFGKTATNCRLATHVIVGNEELAEYARKYNDNVSIVPITIDTNTYQPRSSQRDQGRKPVLGWSGSITTVQHLNRFAHVLQRLATRREFKLHVIGAPNYRLDGVDVEALPWRAETEIEDLLRFDIGTMPLPSDPWTRLRSHLKVRQYMGLGIPSIASPVGVNVEVIQDGENGFLAEDDEAWIDRLSRLIDDCSLRERIGIAGRRTIEDRYSARLWAPRVLDIIRAAASKKVGQFAAEAKG